MFSAGILGFVGIIAPQISKILFGYDYRWLFVSNILIGSSNYNLTNATIYYYSESAPTGTGRYWHYDTDGKTVVIW